MVIGARGTSGSRTAFFLNLCDTGTTKATKALVSAGHKRLSCVSLCYHADFAKILRSNIR